MFNKVIGRLFGTRHERERRRVQPIIDEIVAIEARLATLPDSDIQAQTAKFRAHAGRARRAPSRPASTN